LAAHLGIRRVGLDRKPCHFGLFRLAGIARSSGGGEVPWIVVLKVVADVDLTGDPVIDRFTHEPEGINYFDLKKSKRVDR
jgi:hypothetical protein